MLARYISAIVEESLLRQKISARNPKPKIIKTKDSSTVPYNKKHLVIYTELEHWLSDLNVTDWVDFQNLDYQILMNQEQIDSISHW